MAVLQGRLERLFTDGFIEGWAFDPASPRLSTDVEVRDDAGEVAANGGAHRFRDDLADRGVGFGWCGFLLRFRRPARISRGHGLTLWSADGQRLDERDDIPVSHEARPTVWLEDPFTLPAIAALRRCDDIFRRFIDAKGADAFVRTALIYVLDRGADPESVALDAEMIERGLLRPFALLARLAGTVEFQTEPRRLASPKSAEFPFFVDVHAR